MVQLFFGGSFEFLLEGPERVGNGKKKGKERKKVGMLEERGRGRRETDQIPSRETSHLPICVVELSVEEWTAPSRMPTLLPLGESVNINTSYIYI